MMDYKYYPFSLKRHAHESVKKIPFSSLTAAATATITITTDNRVPKFQTNVTSRVIRQSVSNAFPRIHSPTVHMPARATSQENMSTSPNMWWNNWPQQPLMSSRLPHYWTGSKRRVHEGYRPIQLSHPVIVQQRNLHISNSKMENTAKSEELINLNDPFTTSQYNEIKKTSDETCNTEKVTDKNYPLQPVQRNISSKLSRRATSRPALFNIKNSKILSAATGKNEFSEHHGVEDISSPPILSEERLLDVSHVALNMTMKRSHTFTEVLQSQALNQLSHNDTSFISLADCGRIESSCQENESSDNLLTWEIKCSTWLTHMWLVGGARCLDDLCIYGFG